ncbi:hypothetical protein L1987_34815 [Smallanthus sonchifolius]|uniref:Uncharacterized protein n=1 Tax=Smallanthus sonchifolius TaxID=185202 RepID=A0ACB9HW41_9ASTR|nr:hypothetical protein L1987_34815 [Smallanthus sonchifolius]
MLNIRSSFFQLKKPVAFSYRSRIFCMWRSKAGLVFAKSKKSSSTGSGSHGSRRWTILSSRRRSNTEEVAGKLKTTTSSFPSFHELFLREEKSIT